MMEPVLRPYQRQVIEDFESAVALGNRRNLLVAPTGSGKTVIAAAIAQKLGEPVLFIAHRRELVRQASEKLYQYGIDAGIIQAGFHPRPDQPVQIASVQTLHARAFRRNKIQLPDAALVIVDEAHHARARTWQQIIEAYPNATILGMTATPCRGDGRGLGNIFETMIECPPVADLIDLGFLVPTRVYAPSIPDLTGVQVARGDYVERQLAEAMDRAQLVGDIVTHWHRLAERRKTVVFASGVAHSIHLRDEFQKSGVQAEHIDAKTPKDERDDILDDLGNGKIELVSNAMVLTEGWDQPEVSCAVLARPTKHMGLYRQMIGRVLRPAQGKADALILDHAGAVFQHGFVEDHVEWTLDTDRRAENPAHKARSLPGSVNRLTTCPECSAIRVAGEACVACGWKPERRGQHVDVADGQLGQVDRKRRVQESIDTPEERTRWHAELSAIGVSRGYKPGWIAHKFRERFGTWPQGQYTTPQDPSPEVLSWVRSRNIAYAKARAKVGAM